MPYSILTYPGDGVTTTWPINFTLGFISRDDVKCRVGAEVDGLNQPVYRTLTWISDGLVEVQGTPAAIGQNVEFTRTVAKDELVHDYQDGAPITESNLDDSNKQLMMLLHEILDDRLRVLPAHNLDMNAKRIVNLGAGVDPTDAVTVQQAAQAIALTPTAVQAASDAAQALADAEDAKTDAEAAKDAAEGYANAAASTLANAMLKSQNLNDVADKVAARANLDVYSKAESAVAALPDQSGNSGKFLKTDGTAASWQDISGQVKSVKTQVFTSSATYTPSTGLLYCVVEVQGAGGGGGGVGSSSGQGAAAGGASGTYTRAHCTAAQVGASQSVTIGAAGTGGTGGATGTAGTAGGTTSFGALVSCPGGGGGNTGVGTAGPSSGGSPGAAATVAGCTTMHSVQSMAGGCAFGATNTYHGGPGADAPLGIGGARVCTATGGTNGYSGSGYGSGGAGAVSNNATGYVGGHGRQGIVIITEYCSQ